MHVVCFDNEITIRYLEKKNEDFKQICDWLNNENVYKYYGDSDEKHLDFIEEKYGSKIDDESCFPCIIEFHNSPVGYVQFYDVSIENYNLSDEQMKKIARFNDKVMALDIFIGDDNYRDKGLGSRAIKLLISTMFEKYGAHVILIDPKTNNLRAIACYKKCGFKECFVVNKREEKDGVLYDSLIMKRNQED